MQDTTSHTDRHPWRWTAALIATSLALTLAAYWRVLGWPWLFDDAIHLRWLEDRTLLRLWTDCTHMQHYRPLVMSFWWLYTRYVSLTDPLGLQILTLAVHALNGALAGWLAAEMSRSRWTGLAAAALFVLYPLSYQAIPSPGSQSKPISALLILLAVWLYWRGRERHRAGPIIAACVVAALAPTAYESAITAGGFLTLTEYILWRSGRVERFGPWSLAAPALGVPFLAAFLVVPNSYGATGFPGFEALWQSSIYFAQALTWPVAILAKPLMAATGLSDGRATALVSFATLAALALLYVKAKRGHVLLYVLGWTALAIGIQWVTLSFRYVIDAPRMLYAPSVAAALLWADLLAWAMRASGAGSWGRRWLGRVLCCGALAAMLLWSGAFIGARMRMIEAGVAGLESAAEQIASGDPQASTLVINLPAWLSPNETGFALGHEGYLLLPSYYDIGMYDYVVANYGLHRDVTSVSVADLRRVWRYNIGYHDDTVSLEGLAPMIAGADRVLLFDYGDDALRYRDVGGVVGDAQAVDIEPAASYGGAVSLLDATTERHDGTLVIDITWHCNQPLDAPTTAFVHLVAADGHLIAQADGFALGGAYPFQRWEVGQVVRDVREIALPDGADLSGATLAIGLYRTDNGERLDAIGAEGALPDGALRVPVK